MEIGPIVPLHAVLVARSAIDLADEAGLSWGKCVAEPSARERSEPRGRIARRTSDLGAPVGELDDDGDSSARRTGSGVCRGRHQRGSGPEQKSEQRADQHDVYGVALVVGLTSLTIGTPAKPSPA